MNKLIYMVRDKEFNLGLPFNAKDYLGAMITDHPRTNKELVAWRKALWTWQNKNAVPANGGLYVDPQDSVRPAALPLCCIRNWYCVDYLVKGLLGLAFDDAVNSGLQAYGVNLMIHWEEPTTPWGQSNMFMRDFRWSLDPERSGTKSQQTRATMLLKGEGGDRGFGWNGVLKKGLGMNGGEKKTAFEQGKTMDKAE